MLSGIHKKFHSNPFSIKAFAAMRPRVGDTVVLLSAQGHQGRLGPGDKGRIMGLYPDFGFIYVSFFLDSWLPCHIIEPVTLFRIVERSGQP